MSLLQWCVVIWVVTYWSSHRFLVEVGGVLPIGYSWLVSSVVADLSITIGMVYYLGIRLRGEAMHSKTSFNKIIARTIQANILSLLSQVVTFALFKADIGLYFFLNDFTVVKVYAFSLIISLNTRKTAGGSTGDSTQGSKPGFSLSNLSSGARKSSRTLSTPAVSITVKKNVMMDEDKSVSEIHGYRTHKSDIEIGLHTQHEQEN